LCNSFKYKWKGLLVEIAELRGVFKSWNWFWIRRCRGTGRVPPPPPSKKKEGQGGHMLRLIILKICFGNVNLIDEIRYVE
jgi:hypothetical protein